MMVNEVEQIYDLKQSINYFRRKYNQKVSIEKLKDVLEKYKKRSGKDLSYLVLSFETKEKNKEVRLFDLMVKVKEKDVKDLVRIILSVLSSELFVEKGSYKNENLRIDEKYLKLKFKDLEEDIYRILSLTSELEKTDKGVDRLLKFISKKLFDNLKLHLNPDRKKLISKQDREELLFNLDFSDVDDIDVLEKQLEELADKFAYFTIMRKFYTKYGYVLTPKENIMVQDIIEDLNNGRVVALLGETGSGKTELARFICRAFLGKEPIFISGSRYLTDEDFTIQKIVTSKSILDSGEIIDKNKSGLNKKEFIKQVAKEFYEKVRNSEEFRKILREEYGLDEIEISQIDPLKYNLFTEYHIVGLFKGMMEGRPVIIDEVNLIRPEVFMALNDLLTRKVGDEIELPNGLGKIKVKPGFAIILTGNDPDAYSLKQRYIQGRYKFDEATYNRLSTYQKDYYNQTEKIFKDDSEKSDYMDENQLYIVLLMMLFDHKNNKFGVEFLKDEFIDMENDAEKKKKIFEDLRKLAIATRKVQDAYAGKAVQITKLSIDIFPQNDIKRKVLTMRNLKTILQDWIRGKHPLEYYIYKNFIRQAGNEDEKYALLAIFKEVGLFEDLVSDDKYQTFENLENWYKGFRVKKMAFMGKEDNEISPKHIGSKVLITKYDLLKQIYGKDRLLDLSEKEVKQIEEQLLVDNEYSEEEQMGDYQQEMTREELIDYIESLLPFFEKHFNEIQKFLINSREKKLKELKGQEKYKNIADRLHKARQNLDKLEQEGKDVSKLKEEVKKLEQLFEEYLVKIEKINKEFEENKEDMAVVIGVLETGKLNLQDLSEEELKKFKICLEKIIEEVNRIS